MFTTYWNVILIVEEPDSFLLTKIALKNTRKILIINLRTTFFVTMDNVLVIQRR